MATHVSVCQHHWFVAIFSDGKQSIIHEYNNNQIFKQGLECQ